MTTYGLVAAALYLLAVVLLLVVRTGLHRRRTGRSGFNGFRSGAPVVRLAGASFALAVLIGLVAPVLMAVGIAPDLLPDRPGRVVVAGAGVVVAVGGLALGSIGQSAMGRSWRIGVDPAERTELVTEGAFARIRNPIFTALILVQVGTFLVAPSWLSLAGVILMVIGCELQTRLVEEPYLARTHRDYPAYAARTGRFLPGLGRLGKAA